MDTTEAHEILRSTRRLRRGIRAQSRSVWFPLVLFGALVLASGAVCSNDPGSTRLNTLYWLVAAPLGYLAVYGYYRWRELRRGIGEEVRPYLAVGVTLALISTGFLAILLAPDASAVVASVAIGVAVVSWLLHRPFTAVVAALLAAMALVNAQVPILFYGSVLEANTAPVIGVAIAMLVLAWLEQSAFLAAVALVVGIVAGLSGLSIVDNFFDVLPHCGADLAGIGGFMLACGAGAGIVAWARRPR
jgi:hypothetical protein